MESERVKAGKTTWLGGGGIFDCRALSEFLGPIHGYVGPVWRRGR